MNQNSISEEEIKSLKGRGFINNRGTDCFSARIITGNGRVTSEQLRALADAADQYGNSTVVFTTRLTVEMPGIPYQKIDEFAEALSEAGMETGGTGPLVRPVVCCKGTTCKYGQIDTFSVAEEIHERFYKGWHHVTLPHKFKIAVGGCPNNCVKPTLNDIGIMGWRGGYKIFIGGRWGKQHAIARPLDKHFTDREEVIQIIEKALNLFREKGNKGERFSQMIDRLGFEEVEKELLAE